jgi:hypothetical protein
MQFDLNGKRYNIKDLGNKLEIELIKELTDADKLPEQEVDGHIIYKYLDEYNKERIGIKKKSGGGSYAVLVLNVTLIIISIVYIIKIIAVLNR